ncbi:MAG: TIGR04348 family glycosyltransferase [Verrucomicrobiales bacterium]|nr:TIGR04348 family glycosyltransferase [Verrucomicrobiales bacterium]
MGYDPSIDMQIAIATPVTSIATTGNRGTASQWAGFLRTMGHVVTTGGPKDLEVSGADLLIALHGWKTRAAIERFRETNPGGKLIVVLTGTDIYPGPNETVLRSMADADRLVVCQEKAGEKLPAEHSGKVHVIPQSARPSAHPPAPDPDSFEICVIGHLRDVKDPMRAAKAARLLPEPSKIRVLHAGGILEEKFAEQVKREEEENSRYRYLGELEPEAVTDLAARCRAMVISSISEGGARVAGEAIVNRTPVISSKIDGVIGLIGSEDYPGFFPVGDTRALADLMHRFETDASFRRELQGWAEKLAPKFDPKTEMQLLQNLIEGLE